MELYVLGEAHDLAALFPAVRPRDAVFDAFAERAAAALDPAKPRVPIGLVEQGLALLDEDERRRIVESWSLLYPDRWAPLLEDGGCEPLICRAVVCGAVRVAILERCPIPAAAFTLYEGGLHHDIPANVLTLLIPPQAVWSIDEAVLAASLFPRWSSTFDPDRFEMIAAYAGGCIRAEHLSRLRVVVERIEAQLPISGLPTATGVVRDGCDVLLTDDSWCRAIGARLLALYADDPLIGGELATQSRSRAQRGRADEISI